jgi:adenosine deaminase
MRSLAALPKANLHLHLTGSMRPTTLADLAMRDGLPIPAPLPAGVHHGWELFQERYDAARSAVRTRDDVMRVVREAVADNAADGAHWVEIQVDPTSYADRLGGLEAVVETVLEAAAGAAGVVIASSWARPPASAERLARLADRYSPYGVVGFGLSNDERLGRVADFAPAFRIAADAGLRSVPHGGFYEGAWHVRACVEILGAHRIGHGITATRDPATVALLAERGVALEICPASYPPLGVLAVVDLPVRALLNADVRVAFGTDDPLLFGASLSAQYEVARHQLGLTDEELAAIARHSILASAAPEPVRTSMLAGVTRWLA